jgi:hypothetical protein
LFWLKKGDMLVPADTTAVQQKGVVNARFGLTGATAGKYSLVAKSREKNTYLRMQLKLRKPELPIHIFT